MAKYIGPGIYENLVFSEKTKVNEKGTLELAFSSFINDNAVMDAWVTNEVAETVEGRFFVWCPNTTTTVKNSTVKIPKTSAELSTELQQLRKLLVEYAMLIGTKEAAEKAFGGVEAFKGLGFPESEIVKYVDRLDDENVLKKVYTNMCTKFVEYIKGVPNYNKIAFRHKFWRKSPKEIYAILPRATKPYAFESMEVPKEASKIGWTEYELKNKCNDTSPVAASPKVKVDQADDLFAGKGVEDGESKQESTGIDSLI